MSNVMVALPNIGGALCSTPQRLGEEKEEEEEEERNSMKILWFALLHRATIRRRNRMKI